VALTIFHIFVSAITPLALVDALFPSQAGRPLLRRPGMLVSVVALLAMTSLAAFVSSYRPQRLAALALALALTLVAVRLPSAPPRARRSGSSPGLWRLRGAGVIAMVAYAGLIFVVPQLTSQVAGTFVLAAQAADILLLVLFGALLLRIGGRWTVYQDWSPRHALALITGMLAVPILVTWLPPLWLTLEFAATAPFLALLLWLDRRLRRRVPASDPAGPDGRGARLPAPEQAASPS
jgi:hypothetical protein